jgi:hypothetical protein
MQAVGDTKTVMDQYMAQWVGLNGTCMFFILCAIFYFVLFYFILFYWGLFLFSLAALGDDLNTLYDNILSGGILQQNNIIGTFYNQAMNSSGINGDVCYR